MFDALNIPSTPVITCKGCGEDKPQFEFLDPHKDRMCFRKTCRECQGKARRIYYYAAGKMNAYNKIKNNLTPVRSKLTGGV